MQNSAASLAVPLAASLLGCLAVIALVALALLLVARCKRRRRSADGAARKKAAPLPITADARAPQQVQPHRSSCKRRLSELWACKDSLQTPLAVMCVDGYLRPSDAILG